MVSYVPPKRRWTKADDETLVRLRGEEFKSFKDIGVVLNRGTSACKFRYFTLKKQSEGDGLGLPNEDEQILNLRSLGLSLKDTAARMEKNHQEIADRWVTLKTEGKVPADILAICAQKERTGFTPSQDLEILQLWLMPGATEYQEFTTARLMRRSLADLRIRHAQLVDERGYVYLNMNTPPDDAQTYVDEDTDGGERDWECHLSAPRFEDETDEEEDVAEEADDERDPLHQTMAAPRIEDETDDEDDAEAADDELMEE